MDEHDQEPRRRDRRTPGVRAAPDAPPSADDRRARRVLARIRDEIARRDVLRFATLGFLDRGHYSGARPRPRDAAREDEERDG